MEETRKHNEYIEGIKALIAFISSAIIILLFGLTYSFSTLLGTTYLGIIWMGIGFGIWFLMNYDKIKYYWTNG